MSTTGDLPGLPGNELNGDDDAAFEELARRAGAALRRPAPEDGVRMIAARQRRQQALKATVVGGVGVVALIGALVIVSNRDDSVSVSPVDSSPASLPASTTPSPTTNPVDSSPASLPASTTPSPTTNPADSSPTMTPAPSTTAVPFPALDTTFVSPTYGYSFRYLDRGGLTPATELWDPVNQQTDIDFDPAFDAVETGLYAYFEAASTQLPDGASINEWVDEYVAPGGCGVPRSQQDEITIDGLSGRVSECPNRIEATVVAGGRLYLFGLSHDRSDARAVFDAFVATIDLTPETAVDFPALDTTFVSPTYGFSFKYLDRGSGLVPATVRWDPVNQRADIQFDPAFDAVDTGLTAYFEAASAKLPDGVSIDEWVDEYVSPGGCGVPRSQQEEITIDGLPGKVSECPSRVEATVVAGDRLYLFGLGHERSDARAFFEAWVATIDLTPETAAVP